MTHKKNVMKELGGSLYWGPMFETKNEGVNHPDVPIPWTAHIHGSLRNGKNGAFETFWAFILWTDTCDKPQALHRTTGDAYYMSIRADICIPAPATTLQAAWTWNPCQERCWGRARGGRGGSRAVCWRVIAALLAALQHHSSEPSSCFATGSFQSEPRVNCGIWRNLFVDPRAQLMSYRNMSLHSFTANLFIHCRSKCIYFT